MSEMISVASGFQYAINIAYDLNDDSKLKNFIPTNSALKLLEDVLISTSDSATDRARILIGAYGKGKSHIVLMILSILMKKDLTLFEKMLPKLEENERLYQAVLNYYESDKKILPVVISGSNTSLPQAFLLALQRTLSENQLMDVMPDSNYQAAINTINRWKLNYPETYEKFGEAVDMPVKDFVKALEDFDIEKYELFERVYPSLTSGSVFNPFVGFDVIDLYEDALRNLKKAGYTGIYVVYDEFSKFLEANISEASVSDTKMLQDFAEKCNRSASNQMHLMLISHKEISNYIDKLPKQKVDGWRGVSERFSHVHLNNNFSQTYEVIASVIQKDKNLWPEFCSIHETEFRGIMEGYVGHQIFSDMPDDAARKVIYNCYPLHPVSIFILPRLSERIAQNERTLFTFLSANGVSTLPAFLAGSADDKFELITPDMIYDYFEPLLKKEVYSEGLHKVYRLAEIILGNIQEETLEKKIIKTIALIYILEQFEKLKPTRGELTEIFRSTYSTDEIDNAIQHLIEKEYVIYHKRSNDYLQLKESSGVDIKQRIHDTVESQRVSVTLKGTLNAFNFDNYMYPSRYNDEKEMTRYFSFVFINEDEVVGDIDWNLKSEGIEADGVIYALIPSSRETVTKLKEEIIHSSEGYERYVFIVPKRYTEIEELVREYNAAVTLRDAVRGDRILFDEYDVICQDLHDVINAYIFSYSHPEELQANYIHNGRQCSIIRKAALTELLSKICYDVFCQTPIINNEALNKIEPTSIAVTSRTKIITGLLRNELEENLGLTGTGQEVSIMRSTLIRTGVLTNTDGHSEINLFPEDNPLMANLLRAISNFVMETGRSGDKSLQDLYDILILPENHIGIRKGVIPVYLAAVFHEYKQQIVIRDKQGLQKILNADTLLQVNAKPSNYILSYLDWNPKKEEYIHGLARVFSEYIIEAERQVNAYDYVASAMNRWYMGLPKYTKEAKNLPDGEPIQERQKKFLANFKRNIGNKELLFEKIRQDFDYQKEIEEIGEDLVVDVKNAKSLFDGMIDALKAHLILKTKIIFSANKQEDFIEHASLTSIISDWCDKLDEAVFEQLFPNGADRCLGLFKTITNDENMFI
ncbi:MAG: restriction endonuclease subunit S, partial [Lachnospiraceae bacterium]|nr:restriction endonuclease subunit S [Lachnospiraceae bacterium]